MRNGITFIVGMTVGLIAGLVILSPATQMMGKELDSHRALVTDCEKNIPRSIRCILTAIPEEKK
ncbi:hypothetical protein vBPpSSYP_115 [Pseudomonas phage vB_PpS_SYP]|nr:hypothetical protein vBPpSSYP_115 [Pseudomonas phage vB_PpS_SYP]